jgi:hypothetical protein
MSYLKTNGSMLGAGLLAACLAVQPLAAQGGWTALSTIEKGTRIEVRTTEDIDTSTQDGRVYTGTIENDVRDSQGRLAIPANSTAELVVRRDTNDELVLDFDSVTIDGRRYGLDASRRSVDKGGIDVKNSGIGNNKETIKNVGGGALLGTVIGAIIGGGKGAAIGAATGAGAGAAVQILTHGRKVDVPAETLLTYTLRSDLDLDVRDNGYMREGHHFHEMNPN